MKVVQINAVCSGSTGKIAVDISRLLDQNGIENYILYSMGNSDFKNAVKYASDKEIKLNALFAKTSGKYGFHSVMMTKRLIKKLKAIKPDVIQLHNLHGHNVHLGMLFRYLKKSDAKIFWTHHDAWAFTGYCMYFDYVSCDRWKTGCHTCPQKKKYSWFFDKSQFLYEKKKTLFEGFRDLTMITPSAWLGDLIKKSHLGEYPVKVIPNGIDLNLFKPTKSDFRAKYGLADKKIYLGVAMAFEPRKGGKYFLELAKLLPDDACLVLVGLTKEQIASLPENIIGITRTENQKELAGIYTAADVFVNCTLEDNFPTVNLEALACGTPVVTFQTGGSPEAVDETCGSVVPQGDVETMKAEAQKWAADDFSAECRARAEKLYMAEARFLDYINLYKG
ncbi:MAG: glycosyltransferase [Clostridia bacterium]|nr:glycosyltransferase [Clostridia bacterium]